MIVTSVNILWEHFWVNSGPDKMYGNINHVDRFEILFWVTCNQASLLHFKKRLGVFLSPAGMSLTKLSLARNILTINVLLFLKVLEFRIFQHKILKSQSFKKRAVHC
jgi:hypothetical protein